MRRVVVTGMGVVCALGKDLTEVRESLEAGRAAIAPIAQVNTERLRFHNGAEASGYRAEDHFDSKQAQMYDRFAQFALVAARQAIADAGIALTSELRERTVVVTGSCLGGKITEDEGYVELYQRGTARVHPLTIPKAMGNAGASLISIEYGLRGAAWTVSTACSSANHAIGQAFSMIRSGGADMALTGGSEAPFSLGSLKAWEALRVVAPDTCRPFSVDRKGLILGEGGAMLVLEERETALARGARIYGEVAGFGMSSDAHHITQPSVDGPQRAMAAALTDAQLRPEQVGYVNAHGTGTQANDSVESQAIRAVFGGSPAVSSTKSMHGHALGAAGAIEAIATLLGLYCGFLPPTANFTTLDPACDVNVIANQAIRVQVKAALSNSFAFGGLNAVLAFRHANSA